MKSCVQNNAQDIKRHLLVRVISLLMLNVSLLNHTDVKACQKASSLLLRGIVKR